MTSPITHFELVLSSHVSTRNTLAKREALDAEAVAFNLERLARVRQTTADDTTWTEHERTVLVDAIDGCIAELLRLGGS